MGYYFLVKKKLLFKIRNKKKKKGWGLNFILSLTLSFYFRICLALTIFFSIYQFIDFKKNYCKHHLRIS